MSETQNPPEIYPKTIRVTPLDNGVRGGYFRSVRIVFAGAKLAVAGQVTFNLGGGVAIPYFLPDTPYTGELTVYEGLLPVMVSEFSMGGDTLASGTISLLTVDYE